MATATNNIPLPFPSTRDMDAMNNTVKQIINFPAMAMNNMLDNTNNMVKNMNAQVQASLKNLPALPQIPGLPLPPTPQTAQSRVIPSANTPPTSVITAQSINPVRNNDGGPITV